jgi:hypothetical protein
MIELAATLFVLLFIAGIVLIIRDLRHIFSRFY